MAEIKSFRNPRFMTMLRVTLISPFFYPERISTGRYNTYLAEALRDSGLGAITVTCMHPTFPSWKVARTDEQIDGISIERTCGWVRFPASPKLRRIALEAAFGLAVLGRSLWKRVSNNAPTVVIHVVPPTLASLLCQFALNRNTAHVAIVHDLQAIFSERSKGLVSAAITWCIRIVEKKSLRRCRRIVFLSESMRNWALKNYGLSRELTEVHYPFITPPRVEYRRSGVVVGQPIPLSEGEKSLVYSGALGEKQAPERLIEFMALVKARFPDWRVCIFSEGPIFERLKSERAGSGVEFFPLVPDSSLDNLIDRSTIQIIPQAPGTAGASLPSKLPNLVKHGTKILCVTDVDSELAMLLCRYGSAEVAYGWSHEELLNKFIVLSGGSGPSPERIAEMLGLFDINVLITDLRRTLDTV